ncbi:MAG: hypothetical protein Q4C63_02855 [Eubacteriales bacterium]|nr:hypothetical protein [Eubacteriales bacterium]
MSLLLCKKEAEIPYYIETMNLRIRSLQELCYIIYNYPLLAMHDLISPELLDWFRDALSAGYLAARIDQIMAVSAAQGGDGTDDVLGEILRDCNYYSAGEVETCRRRLAFYRSQSREDHAHARGAALFGLRRYLAAIRCFEEENELLSEQERRAAERVRERIRQRRADVLCDIASVRAMLFEKKEALSALADADALCPGERAARLRVLLEQYMPRQDAGTGETSDDLPLEEPGEAVGETAGETDGKAAGEAADTEPDSGFEAAKQRAYQSAAFRELEALEALDIVKRREAISELIRKWKNEYRRMKLDRRQVINERT